MIVYNVISVASVVISLSQLLRCSHCSGTLVEDTPDVGTVDARTLISR